MKRFKGVAVKLGKIALGLLLALGVIHGILTFVWGRRYEAQLAALRAEGRSVTLSELAPRPIPDSENGALILIEAFARLKEPDLAADVEALTAVAAGDGAKLTPETWRKARSAAPRLDSIVSMIDDAAWKPGCVFPTNWSDGFEVLLPHYADLRQASRVVGARAMLFAREGRMDDAVRCATNQVRLAGAIKNDPSVISLLVSLAILRLQASTLQDISQQAPLTEAQARTLFDSLGAVDLESQCVHALDGERALMIAALAESRKIGPMGLMAKVNDGQAPGPGSRIAGLLWRPLSYVDGSTYLRVMRKQIEIARAPYHGPESRGSAEAVESIPRYAPLTRVMTPVFSRLGVSRAVCEADMAVAQVAMALAAYRDRRSIYPAALDELDRELGWKLPDDPFTGEPLVYQRRGQGFALYSIGPDLKDDGGKPMKRGGGVSEPGDIVWDQRG